jgi:hypothetical protein
LIETAIRAILIADATVLAAVNDSPAPRIYVGKVRQKDNQPSISIFRIGGARRYHMQGQSGTVPSMFQIDIFADNAQVVTETADAVRQALTAYQGTISNTCVQACYLQGDQMIWEDGPNLYRVTHSWNVIYEE